jgi:putative radical SAM enzyme (TIGR03279 family)
MMLGSPKAKDVMPILRKLADADILIETQIVLCPDVNDGPALRQTVDDLAALYPAVESISIVPVGLTKHRDGLYPLKAVTVDYARQMIDTVAVWQETLRAELGRPLVYLSDEWYLMSDTPFPPEEVYVDCPVIENGVGMVSAFISDMRRQMQDLPNRLETPLKITLVTAVLAGDTVREHLAVPLNRIENLQAELVVITNEFFGPGVTVSGLLVGRDIVRALEGRGPGDVVYLPPNVLNDDGLFLDDMTLETVSEAAGTEVRLFPDRVEDIVSYELVS